MSRPTNINYDLVAKTAREITDNGEICTLKAIHEIVGGSMSTVNKHWKVWKEKNGFEPLNKPVSQLPSTDINAIFHQEVDKIVNTQHAKYEKAYLEHADTIKCLQQNNDELNTKNEELLKNYELIRDNFTYKDGELSSAKSRIIELQEQLKESQNINMIVRDDLKFTSGELSSTKARIIELEEQLNKSLQINTIQRDDFKFTSGELSSTKARIIDLEEQLKQAMKTENKN
jgi:hypothetical protein